MDRENQLIIGAISEFEKKVSILNDKLDECTRSVGDLKIDMALCQQELVQSKARDAETKSKLEELSIFRVETKAAFKTTHFLFVTLISIITVFATILTIIKWMK